MTIDIKKFWQTVIEFFPMSLKLREFFKDKIRKISSLFASKGVIDYGS